MVFDRLTFSQSFSIIIIGDTMNKGYTLIELLGVILLLTLLTLFILPNVVNSIKKSNEKNEKLMDDIIKSAAKLYMSDNFDDLYIENGFVYCIPLSRLVDAKYLDAPVKYGNYDDATGVKAVKITYNFKYEYTIIDNATCLTMNTLVIQDQTKSSKASFLGTNVTKDKIESVHFVNNQNIPAGATDVYDVSEFQNGSIKLWYLDSNSNNLYEVYIGSANGINANVNSSRLFANLVNATTIDLTNLNTDMVVNANYMFSNCTSLMSLVVPSLDTSSIETMSHMFENCSSITSININSFTTEKLENVSHMFAGTSSLAQINMTNANFGSVSNADSMFTDTKSDITINTNSNAATFISNTLANCNVSDPTVNTN